MWLGSRLNGFLKPLSLSRPVSLTGVDSGFVWRGPCRRGCAVLTTGTQECVTGGRERGRGEPMPGRDRTSRTPD